MNFVGTFSMCQFSGISSTLKTCSTDDSQALFAATWQAFGMRRIPALQVFLSLTTLACWIMLYAAGLLLESVEERIVLAPHTMQKQLGSLQRLHVSADSVVATPPTSTTTSGKTVETKVAVKEKSELLIDSILSETPARSVPRSFFVALLIYTPTNLALLTLFAGCLGGCVSNIKYSMMDDVERQKLSSEESAILCENPLSATIRGFVIYLCLVAGLYAAVDDPFKDSTPGQYARLAGTLSLVAFIVGFDPSRIKTWLKMAEDGPKTNPVAPPPKV